MRALSCWLNGNETYQDLFNSSYLQNGEKLLVHIGVPNQTEGRAKQLFEMQIQVNELSKRKMRTLWITCLEYFVLPLNFYIECRMLRDNSLNGRMLLFPSLVCNIGNQKKTSMKRKPDVMIHKYIYQILLSNQSHEFCGNKI